MLQGVAGVVLDVVFWAVLAANIFAFVHAALQRPDAYTATDKLSKPAWLGILGAAALLSWVLGVTGMAISAVAAGVYLVDVRPRLLEVQGKSR
ncbi:MAG: DUF2516 family protein [Mycobacterium sp.]|jgi:hypothetical protein